MKKLFAVCAIAGLASSAVIAADKCGDVAFSQGFDESSVMLGKAGTALLSFAQPRHPGKWLVNNYDRRITISIEEMDGEKCVRLKLDPTLNFTMNRNKLVELYGDGQDDITNNLFIGESLGAIYGYVWDGVVNEDDKEYIAANGVTPGDIKNVDLDGDGKITPNDRTILGFNKEAFRMSLSTNLSYKGWNLYALFNGIFSGGRYGKALNNNAYMSYTEGMMYLNTVDHPYWTPENKSEIYPKPWNAQGDLYAIHNYGFVRLQDLSLSYTFGGSKIKKAGIQSLQLYATGNNLFFIAPDWKYSDPEVRSIQSQQLRRTYTFGVNIRF